MQMEPLLPLGRRRRRRGPSALRRHKNESLNGVELEPGGAQIEAEKRGFELRASKDVAGRWRVGLSWPGRRSHGACSISDGEWEQRDGEERDFVVLLLYQAQGDKDRIGM
jgi:hypothetical protein